jgi:hypothetical protein
VILDQLLKLDFEWLDLEGLSMLETLPKYLETKVTTRTPWLADASSMENREERFIVGTRDYRLSRVISHSASAFE